MDVHASAPGKLVLTGEYAVLEGAPAVVMAVDRRARVELEPGDADYCFDAPGLGIAGACCQLVDGEAGPQVRWRDVDPVAAERLGLVRTVLESVAADARPAPFRARLDTRGFFTDDGGRRKLGLGSSAALTVALSGAIHAHDGRHAPPAAYLVNMHRRMQNGRGSGVDIASSLSGGVIVYRFDASRPHIEPVAWPEGLHVRCVWSGQSASTGAYLKQLERWRSARPAQSATVMASLAQAALAAEMAVRAAKPESIQSAVTDYAHALDRLADASGIDIVCGEHRQAAAIAADCGVAYKTCGAGGGDIGIALSVDPERIAAFEARLVQARIQTLDVTVDTHGLRLN